MSATHDEILVALTNRYGDFVLGARSLGAGWDRLEVILSDDGGTTRLVVRLSGKELLSKPGSQRDGINAALSEARQRGPAQ